MTHLRFQAIAVALVVVVVSFLAQLANRREAPRNRIREEHAFSKVGEPGDESAEALNRDTEYGQARQAPGLVLPGAYAQAFSALTSLGSGSWSRLGSNLPVMDLHLGPNGLLYAATYGRGIWSIAASDSSSRARK